MVSILRSGTITSKKTVTKKPRQIYTKKDYLQYNQYRQAYAKNPKLLKLQQPFIREMILHDLIRLQPAPKKVVQSKRLKALREKLQKIDTKTPYKIQQVNSKISKKFTPNTRLKIDFSKF